MTTSNCSLQKFLGERYGISFITTLGRRVHGFHVFIHEKYLTAPTATEIQKDLRTYFTEDEIEFLSILGLISYWNSK